MSIHWREAMDAVRNEDRRRWNVQQDLLQCAQHLEQARKLVKQKRRRRRQQFTEWAENEGARIMRKAMRQK